MTVGDLLRGQWFVMRELTLMRTKVENKRGTILCVSSTGEVLHVHKTNQVDQVLGTRLVYPQSDDSVGTADGSGANG